MTALDEAYKKRRRDSLMDSISEYLEDPSAEEEFIRLRVLLQRFESVLPGESNRHQALQRRRILLIRDQRYQPVNR